MSITNVRVNTGIGMVTGGTVNFGGGGHTSATTDSSSETAEECDLLVVVAKDKEWLKMKSNFAANMKNWDESEKARHPQLPSVAQAKGTFNGRHIVFVLIEKMGLEAVKPLGDANGVLAVLRPKRVTTVGFCAGKPEHKMKVLMITTARYVSAGNAQEVKADDNTKLQETWRALDKLHRDDPEMYQDIVARFKDNDATVFSSSAKEADDNPESVANLLQEHGAHGLDMEIGHIWRVVNAHKRKYPSITTQILPAFKGVSDAGSKPDRDGIPGDTALSNVSHVFISYLSSYFPPTPN